MNLIESLKNEGILLPYSEDLEAYKEPLFLYGKRIDNRIGIQPLEVFKLLANIFHVYQAVIADTAGPALICRNTGSKSREGYCVQNQHPVFTQGVVFIPRNFFQRVGPKHIQFVPRWNRGCENHIPCFPTENFQNLLLAVKPTAAKNNYCTKEQNCSFVQIIFWVSHSN